MSEIKTDASKLESFNTGAKREDKTGKGRYDLIPGDIMDMFEEFIWETYFKNGTTTCSETDVSKSAYFDDWTNIELYFDFIFNMISYFFVPYGAKEEFTDDTGEVSYEITWEAFRAGLYVMRAALAKHYEGGAKIHGVDNWKKGLPIYGSERGGCFLDSMRRHADQALSGADDEPHAVAALWNAFGAVWTLKNQKDIENEHITLPSGRKVRVQFNNLENRTPDIMDREFLHAIGLSKNEIDQLLKNISNPDPAKIYNDWVDSLIDSCEYAAKYNQIISRYHDAYYNLKECITLLGDLITSDNFIHLYDGDAPYGSMVNLYLYCFELVRYLNDLLPFFYKDEKAMLLTASIIKAIFAMFKANVGNITICGERKNPEWKECPAEKREFMRVKGDPDQRWIKKLNVVCNNIISIIKDNDHFRSNVFMSALLQMVNDVCKDGEYHVTE